MMLQSAKADDSLWVIRFLLLFIYHKSAIIFSMTCFIGGGYFFIKHKYPPLFRDFILQR